MEGMDLETFIADRELLGRLSREYELLKASGADVDMAAWVQMRLREAAAELAKRVVAAEQAHSEDARPNTSHDGGLIPGRGSGTDATAENEQLVLPQSGDFGPAEGEWLTEQLSYTRSPAMPKNRLLPGPLPEAGAAGLGPEMVWFLRGEGAGPASHALANAIHGPSSGYVRSSLARNTPTQSTQGTKKQKRVVIVSPRKSPAHSQQVPTTTQVLTPLRLQAQALPPPTNKLYTRVEPGLFTVRPDAYVHPEARPRRTPHATSRPDWVNAASLQAALRGASSAVPHMQAAADRERRLALSTALARQTLAAGLGQDDARAVAVYGALPGATAAARAAHAQYDHVLQVAQLLAQQNEQLARAMQLNSEQLAQQQALLESTMQPRPARPHQGSDVGNETWQGGNSTAHDSVPAMRVEVESGPPAWFASRRAHDSSSAVRSKSPGERTDTRSRSRSKSPGTAAAGGRSSTRAAVHATRAMALPSAAATTTKERERTARKESLKELLRQVLGGVGLAGGKEGRRRLASGVAEAEKLVAAIQALARSKGYAQRGRGRGTGREAGQTEGAVAAATQTSSGPASASGDNAASLAAAAAASEGAVGGATAGVPPQPGASRSSSRARYLSRTQSGGSASAAAAPAAAGREPSAPSLHNLSQQGSEVIAVSGSERSLARAHAGLSAGRARSAAGRRSEAGTEGPGARFAGAAASSGGAQSTSYTPVSSQGSELSVGSLPKAPEPHVAVAGAGRVLDGPVASDARPVSQQPQSNAGAIQAAGATGAPAEAGASDGGAGVAAAGRAAAAAASAAGAQQVALARGVPPGVMVESLEDQVQQIVERDAASWAEAARLRKIEMLEQRLHSMVDKVENKLARVLQPLQLNAQQLLQQAGLMDPGGEWELQLGPDGHPLPDGLVAGARAKRAEAPGVAAVSVGGDDRGRRVGGARGNQDGSDVQGPGGVIGPRSAGLSVLELQRMLIQLNRMESKEQEVRRKWFHDVRDPKHRGPAPQPIIVRDGQIGTLDPGEPPTSPPTLAPVARARTAERTGSPPVRGLLWFAHPPTESALATVAADSHRSALASVGTGPGPEEAGGLSTLAQDGTAAADESLADPISDAVLESVLRGRRRFLRAQKLADGDLVAAAEPNVNPVQIMEDVADALLEEVLREQAQELAGLCDMLGEHMLKDEFGLDEEDEQRRAGRRSLPPRNLGPSFPTGLF